MEFEFSSPNLKAGDFIPFEYTGYGVDISPEFHIKGINEDAVTMIITLDDADHPRIKNFNHWIAFNIPPVEMIPSRLQTGSRKMVQQEKDHEISRRTYHSVREDFVSIYSW